MKKAWQIAAVAALLLLAGNLISCREGRARKNEVASPRIVSLAPNLTEIVFILGMGDHLVGVTDHCNYPPEVKTKPRLGGLKTISLEAVISRNPDIIFATKDGNDLAFLDELKKLNYKLYTFEPRTMDEVLQTISSAAEIMRVESRGRQVVDELKAKQEYVEKSVEASQPVSVLLAYQRQPLILAGPGTFADDLIKNAGGANLAGDSKIPYPRYSLEMVVEKAPEVIIDATMGEFGAADKEAHNFWSQWPDLPAVKNNKIEVLDPDLVSRPGPRLFDGLVQLAKILHPEKFEAKK